MLTQDVLKQYVIYDPATGYFLSTGVKYSNKIKGERVGTLHKTKGYEYVNIKGKSFRAQRLAFLYMTGEWPKNQVDHINRIKSDNKWANLRDVDSKTNCWNRPLYKTSTSGFTGVAWNKQYNKWQVLCRSNGRQEYLGLYENLAEAGQVAATWYAKNREQV